MLFDAQGVHLKENWYITKLLHVRIADFVTEYSAVQVSLNTKSFNVSNIHFLEIVTQYDWSFQILLMYILTPT